MYYEIKLSYLVGDAKAEKVTKSCKKQCSKIRQQNALLQASLPLKIALAVAETAAVLLNLFSRG